MKIFKSNFFLVFCSVIITLAILEILLIFFYNKPFKYEHHSQRYLLWEEGNVFQNIGRIFKYQPNLSIQHDAYYFINNKWLREYSYEINTNNFGLVQDQDISTDVQSILFLGDSMTEGLGAPSWVNKFGDFIKGYQVINGGIFGSGPQQFELMEQHVSEQYNIKKVVFIYIGSDISRDPFNFSTKRINCIKDHSTCIGNENFFGFPLQNENPENFLNILKEYRNIKDNKRTFKKLRRKIKKQISSLNIVHIPRNYFKNKFYKSKNVKISNNFKSIERLVKKYDKNIIFVNIKTIDEIYNGGMSYYSIYTEKFINNLHHKVYICDMNNDPKNFYKYDGHPNIDGYNILFKCVDKIINQNL